MPNSDDLLYDDPLYWIRFSQGAAWRWDVAYSRAANFDDSPPDWFDDQLIVSLYHVLRTEIWKEDLPSSVARDTDFLAKLEQIRAIHGDNNQRLAIEARVLANLPVDTIAERCGLDPEIVEFYEQIHFDIRKYLYARSYVMTHAVGRPGEVIDPLRDVILKPSYFGGPLVAERLLEHLPYLGQEHDLTTAAGRERERLEISLLWAKINLGQANIKSYPQLLEIYRLSKTERFPTVSEMFGSQHFSADVEDSFPQAHKFGANEEVGENAMHGKEHAA